MRGHYANLPYNVFAKVPIKNVRKGDDADGPQSSRRGKHGFNDPVRSAYGLQEQRVGNQSYRQHRFVELNQKAEWVSS